MLATIASVVISVTWLALVLLANGLVRVWFWRTGLNGARGVDPRDALDVAEEYGELALPVERAPRPTLRQRLPGLGVWAVITLLGCLVAAAAIDALGMLALFVAICSFVAGGDAARVLARHAMRRDQRAAARPRPAAGYSPIS